MNTPRTGSQWIRRPEVPLAAKAKAPGIVGNAPPVYRPQPAREVLQPAMQIRVGSPRSMQPLVNAPAPFRPQRSVQPTIATTRAVGNVRQGDASISTINRPAGPVSPLQTRAPQPTTNLPKLIGPPVYRPEPRTGLGIPSNPIQRSQKNSPQQIQMKAAFQRVVQRMQQPQSMDTTVTMGRTPRSKKSTARMGEYSSGKYDAEFKKEADFDFPDEEDAGSKDTSAEDPSVTEADLDKDLPGDWSLPGGKEPFPYSRPGWNAGTYMGLYAKQLKGGQLYCGVCNGAIALVGGKEVWTSKSGKKHKSQPPIDHFSPDWIVRLAELKDWLGAQQLAGKTYNQVDTRKFVVEAFHKSPLRITHMVCNSARPKSS